MPKFSLSSIAAEDAIVKSLVSDLAGGCKEIIFPSSVITELVEVGIAYDGSSFQGINQINASDAIIKGVPETIVKVPESISDTEKNEYWIICDILTTDHKPHPNCARSTLMHMQEKLSKTWEGGSLFMGCEPEAYFVEDSSNVGGSHGGNSNYFNPKDPKATIITEIVNTLMTMGFTIERAHTEVGDDQFEVNWKYDRAERTADRVQIYKIVAHKIAQNHGLDVSFLPKPYPTRNGSGMHCHMSVSNKDKNLYYDASKKDQKYFSDSSLHFLAGILKHIRALSAIGNKTEVSYARLVPGFEAPCISAIGDCNRSAACRIPAIPDDKIRKYAQRTEFRFPDPLTNPYLLAAGFIAAGIDGLNSKETFPGFCEENLYALSHKEINAKGYTMLPRNLWEAYQAFEENDVLKSSLGIEISDSFADLLMDEIDGCQAFANTESIRRHYLA